MNSEGDIQLRRFLNVYWLRPENGLALTLKSRAFRDVALAGPSLDVSCGNGLFMFLHLGGEVHEDYDVYYGTRASEFSHSGDFIDIYASFDETLEIPVVKRPDSMVDVGTDWKDTLLSRARQLDVYRTLLLHDNNHTPLPLPADHFQTIYSNSIYWVQRPAELVNDVKRMLASGGLAVLEVMTPYMLDPLNALEPIVGPRATRILNRQRRETMPGLRTTKEWSELFGEAGLAIEDIRIVYPSKTTVQMWNVGMRPISHLLIQMAENLEPDQRRRIKAEWVEIMYDLACPLLSLPPSYDLDTAPYLAYLLRKRP